MLDIGNAMVALAIVLIVIGVIIGGVLFDRMETMTLGPSNPVQIQEWTPPPRRALYLVAQDIPTAIICSIQQLLEENWSSKLNETQHALLAHELYDHGGDVLICSYANFATVYDAHPERNWILGISPFDPENWSPVIKTLDRHRNIIYLMTP